MNKRFLVQFELALDEVPEDYNVDDALQYVERMLTTEEKLLEADSANNATVYNIGESNFTSVRQMQPMQPIQSNNLTKEYDAYQQGDY